MVIAHRLVTVRNADKIVVMKQGSVIESGNHQQLMDTKGAYFALIKLASKAVSSNPKSEIGKMGRKHETSSAQDLLKSSMCMRYQGQGLEVYFNSNKSAIKYDIANLCLVLAGLGVLTILAMIGQQGFCGWAGSNLATRVHNILFRSILKTRARVV
nr:ABC transporter B family member 19-like [Tanacetum cinerariifolium]